MMPSGGYKGLGNDLAAEVFAIAGATLGKDASPFSGTVGGPPTTARIFFTIAPAKFSNVNSVIE